MNSFATLAHACLRLFFESLSHSKHLGYTYVLDEIGSIATRIEKKLGVRCTHRKDILSNVLPILHYMEYTLHTKRGAISASARHLLLDITLLKATGEALERFSAQFPLSFIEKIDDQQTHHILREKKAYIKSLFGTHFRTFRFDQIYYGFSRKSSDQARNSNGYAGHFSKKEAILNGLLELIERDAFLVHWLNTISPRHIDLANYSSNDPNTEYLLRSMRMHNIEYFFLDITSDIQVPVCLCILRQHGLHGPQYFFGTSAGFNLDQLLLASASEALGILATQSKKAPFPLPKDYIPFNSKNEVNLHDRMRIFFTKDMEPFLQFLLTSNEFVTGNTFIEEIVKKPQILTTQEKSSYILDIFRERYRKNSTWDIFVIQIRNKLLDEFGYHVVRVVCDALYPMYLTESEGNPNHPRLTEFVKAKGLEKVAKLNTTPHPFP